MASDELNQLKDIIEKNNRQVKDTLEIVSSKVNKLETYYSVMSEMVRMLRDQQSVMNEKIDNLQKAQEEMKESLEANTASVMQMEATFKAYGDMYKINADNIFKLESRIKETEKDLGIKPHPELLLVK